MIGLVLLIVALFLYSVWVEVDGIREWLAIVATVLFVVGGVSLSYGV